MLKGLIFKLTIPCTNLHPIYLAVTGYEGPTSSPIRGLISFFCSLGGLTASVTFLGINDQLTACFRALCSVVWIIRTVLAERPESSLVLLRGCSCKLLSFSNRVLPNEGTKWRRTISSLLFQVRSLTVPLIASSHLPKIPPHCQRTRIKNVTRISVGYGPS